jgi:hypothetical protein
MKFCGKRAWRCDAGQTSSHLGNLTFRIEGDVQRYRRPWVAMIDRHLRVYRILQRQNRTSGVKHVAELDRRSGWIGR